MGVKAGVRKSAGASRRRSGTLNRPFNVWCGLVCRHFVCPCRVFAKREAKRLPYKRDFIQRRNVVRTYQKPSPVGEGGSRRLTDEVSVSLFALSFGFAQTNAPSQTAVGEGLAPPVLCSHNHLAEKK